MLGMSSQVLGVEEIGNQGQKGSDVDFGHMYENHLHAILHFELQ